MPSVSLSAVFPEIRHPFPAQKMPSSWLLFAVLPEITHPFVAHVMPKRLTFATLPEIAHPAAQEMPVAPVLLAVQPSTTVLLPTLMPFWFASACTFLTMPKDPV